MRHKKRSGAALRVIRAAVIVVAALALLVAVLFSSVFTVKNIMVIGHRNLLEEEVITQSGIKKGDNLLGITSESLERKLEQNRYIQYAGHGFDYRGTLTIHIDERLPMAVLYELGLFYTLDETGMVLECVGKSYPEGAAGPRVTGLDFMAHSRIIIGSELPVRNHLQLEEMECVLLALDQTNLLSRVSELNVRNIKNMYVMTADGAKIEIGDSSNLEIKLLIAKEVLAVRGSGNELKGAKIDVSNGKNAHFIPAVLPTVTPVPTPTPTIAPAATP